MKIQSYVIDDIKEFDATFETDEGILMCQVLATNLEEAVEKLSLAFPDHIGADGFITDRYGDDHPINW